MASLNKKNLKRGVGSKLFRNGMFQRPSDLMWFLVSFILFLVLGPFSAPIALMFVLKEGRKDEFALEPEPAKVG